MKRSSSFLSSLLLALTALGCAGDTNTPNETYPGKELPGEKWIRMKRCGVSVA